jgi:hypothetical protein
MRFPIAITTILACILIVSCDGKKQGEPMKKEYNRSGQLIEVVVIEHASYEELQQAFVERNARYGVDIPPFGQVGWSAWSTDPPYQCEVHVVAPKYIDDEETLTLGHEMAHCLYGSFHD